MEMREPAVKLVLERQSTYESQRAVIRSIANKFGVTPEIVRKWVRRARIDEGKRPRLTTEERGRWRSRYSVQRGSDL